jgi:hypothetical protein
MRCVRMMKRWDLSLFGIGSDSIAVPEALSVGVNRGVCTHGAAASSGVRGRGTAGPVIGIGLRLEFLINVEHVVTCTVRWVANLDIVVIPTEFLVRLRARKEIGAAKEEADAGN